MNMMFTLKRIAVVCSVTFAVAFLAACSDSPEDAYEKWHAAVLAGDEETASALVYISPDGSGVSVKHYNANVINNIKNVPAAKARMESVDVDGSESAGDDLVILTLTYEEGEEEKEIKQAMRNVEGQWKLDPYASMPLMNLFVKADEKNEAAAETNSAYAPAGNGQQEESARDTNLTGGNPDFESATEGVQIDFANE